jgi:hypothetical protein
MKLWRFGLVLAAVVTVLGSSVVSASAAAAAVTTVEASALHAMSCKTNDVYLGLPLNRSAEAHWTECSNAGFTQVNGWVKDTKKDNLCAQVYADWTGGAHHESDKACGQGNIAYFYWNERGSAMVFLRKVG